MLASRYAGNNSALRTAADSLERIKARQAETAARISASQEVEALTGDSDLTAKLAKAGLVDDSSSGAAVLARFKAKTAALPPPTATPSLAPPVNVPGGDKVG